jgi:hypothetical protein
MTTAAEAYAARIDAVNEQRKRIRVAPAPADRWSGPMAKRFHADPHRELDANLAAIAENVRPDDVLIDAGGGAGRLGLPLALRCREVIVVDPSPGMQAEFEEVVAEAGIKNARFVHADWLQAEGIRGDVVLCAHVTYFVREIVPFIQRLDAAARRLVMIHIGHVPPPAMNTKLFKFVHGEEQAVVPGQRELLPVLWDMGIVPDVRVLPESFAGVEIDLPTREDAVRFAVISVDAEGNDAARRRIEEGFDELFEPSSSGNGFAPRWRSGTPQLLISWNTRG